MGPGWVAGGDVHWHLDDSESHNGTYALKSGEIVCTGTSSISREIEGPAEISFWWKKSKTTGANRLTFSVDGYVQRTCDFNEWKYEQYTMSDNGTHEIEWTFYKKSCYPQSKGEGWIDSVTITEGRTWSESVTGHLDSTSEISGNISRAILILNDNLSELKYCLNGINNSVTGLDEGLIEVNNSVRDLEKGLNDINDNLTGLDEDLIVGVNNSVKGLEECLNEIKDRVTERDERIIGCADAIYIRPSKNLDLTEELNKHVNKTIYLESGVYQAGIVDITTNNILVKSVSELGAVLDGNGKSYNLGLNNTLNVSIEGILLHNSSGGIVINNSSSCHIENNKIVFINGTGVHLSDSDYNIIVRNSIVSNNDMPHSNDIGIWVSKSNHTLILDNTINVYSNNIYINGNSTNNAICDSNNGYVHDNGITYNVTNCRFNIVDQSEYNYYNNYSNFWVYRKCIN